jgi:ligand-binding SRPBCC domain-containing protein
VPGVPVRVPWLALIEQFRWDVGFCDVQLHGPFACWRHCHSVRDATREGHAGTVVRDEVAYELPLWPVSALAAPLGAAGMRLLFRARQRRAAALLPQFAADGERRLHPSRA